jgi:hypothetical protein
VAIGSPPGQLAVASLVPSTHHKRPHQAGGSVRPGSDWQRSALPDGTGPIELSNPRGRRANAPDCFPFPNPAVCRQCWRATIQVSEPPSPAIPSTAENQQDQNNDDQQCGIVHAFASSILHSRCVRNHQGCLGAVGSGWVGDTGTVGAVVAGGVGVLSPVVCDAGATVAGGCLIKMKPISNTAKTIAPTSQYIIEPPLVLP